METAKAAAFGAARAFSETRRADTALTATTAEEVIAAIFGVLSCWGKGVRECF